MSEISTAKEIGLRCRRLRNALGLSQDALAEKVGIQGATISKYEREGIYDIEKIQELSNALGHDLLSDEVDQEGVIGEVGKEILYLLTQSNGYLTFDRVHSSMFGMPRERVSKEIFKLERIGMCVREQYKDWHDKGKDVVFITSKGIISLKNAGLDSVMSQEVYDELPNVTSYEEVIEGFDSYQDFIDKNPTEKIIRKLAHNIAGGWYDNEEELYSETATKLIDAHLRRINYIVYLYNEFTSDIFKNEIDGPDLFLEFMPSKDIFHDILYRMALGHTNEFVYDQFVDPYPGDFVSPECWEMAKKVDKLIAFPHDLVLNNTLISFRNEFDFVDNWLDTKNEMDEVVPEGFEILDGIEEFSDMPYDIDELSTYYMERVNQLCKDYMKKTLNELVSDDNSEVISGELLINLSNLNSNFKKRLDKIEYKHLTKDDFVERYNERRPKGGSKYPIDWFSDDEIRDFINENFGPALTDEDKQVDEMLRKVNELIPETLDYYNFPIAWEDNGLADLIRDNFGLSQINDGDTEG